jgi:hypothetical protein
MSSLPKKLSSLSGVTRMKKRAGASSAFREGKASRRPMQVERVERAGS